MIGNIVEMFDTTVKIKSDLDIKNIDNILNRFILLSDSFGKYIGKINKVTNEYIWAEIVGKYTDDGKVIYGISNMPSLGANSFIINNDFTKKIIQTYDGELLLGKTVNYDTEVKVGLDSFFSNHFAIFGATGSGKSCSFARIIQNLFNNNRPKNSHFVIFDAYGEYHNAFKNIEGFKNITTDTRKENIVKIPPWFLSSDDYALLLNAKNTKDVILIDKALRYLNIFKKNGEEVNRYKNSIIAKSLFEILISGKNPVNIRDQIIALLSKYNTNDINLESKLVQPGYVRTFRQCLLIDSSGKINAIEMIQEFLINYFLDDVELSLPDGSYKYTLEDLYDALDFALIDEGVWRSDYAYDETNHLKVSLNNLIKNDYSLYFECNYISKDKYIEELFLDDYKQKVQVLNININYVDDRFAKNITKIFSKLFFDYVKDGGDRGNESYNLILEEAHRYVQNDSDINIIGYNIFERICKEGRKYGVIVGFVSQRPSELSETCLSQCLNYIIFKMIHEKDVNFIKNSIPFMSQDLALKIKNLAPGNAYVFGNSFNMPVIVKFEMPNPRPYSESVIVSNVWFK